MGLKIAVAIISVSRTFRKNISESKHFLHIRNNKIVKKSSMASMHTANGVSGPLSHSHKFR